MTKYIPTKNDFVTAAEWDIQESLGGNKFKLRLKAAL